MEEKLHLVDIADIRDIVLKISGEKGCSMMTHLMNTGFTYERCTGFTCHRQAKFTEKVSGKRVCWVCLNSMILKQKLEAVKMEPVHTLTDGNKIHHCSDPECLLKGQVENW